MSVFVRAACSTDRLRIWQLLLQFAKSYVPNEKVFEVTFTGLVEDPRARILVIEKHGAVVGYVLAFVLPTLFANGAILEVLELVMDEEKRGAGLGKVLVEELLKVAWECGCVEAVVPSRRATPFYEKLGFERTAEYLKVRKPT